MQSIPKLWLGTLYLSGDLAKDVIRSALDMGYTHIDTAQVYENEEDIGEALLGKDRDSFWLTTKIDFRDYGSLYPSFLASLQKLQMEYVDLLLLHRPTNLPEHERALDVMMQLQDEGKVRNIGVSNFTVVQLQHAWKYTGGRIYTNQIEYHPCLSQDTIKAFADEQGIVITAYSPLGHGNLLNNQTLQMIADKHGASVAQICIAWLLQQGCVVIPKASSVGRLKENFDAQTLELDEEDFAMIASLPKHHRYIDPPFAPEWDKS